MLCMHLWWKLRRGRISYHSCGVHFVYLTKLTCVTCILCQAYNILSGATVHYGQRYLQQSTLLSIEKYEFKFKFVINVRECVAMFSDINAWLKLHSTSLAQNIWTTLNAALHNASLLYTNSLFHTAISKLWAGLLSLFAGWTPATSGQFWMPFNI